MQKIITITLLVNIATSCGLQKTNDTRVASQPFTDNAASTTSYFIDVHQMEPGQVKFADVAAAHAKDLAVQNKHQVNFIKYWVDEGAGKIYCLSSAPTGKHVEATHAEAHGLMPAVVYQVSDGPEAALSGNKPMFMDIHELGANAVTTADVAGAHEKDMAVQQQYGVNFINYWVDTGKGVIMCLSEAPDSSAVKLTHQHAHGLLPKFVAPVKQGQ